jgi:hypothetical protein
VECSSWFRPFNWACYACCASNSKSTLSKPPFLESAAIIFWPSVTNAGEFTTNGELAWPGKSNIPMCMDLFQSLCCLLLLEAECSSVAPWTKFSYSIAELITIKRLGLVAHVRVSVVMVSVNCCPLPRKWRIRFKVRHFLSFFVPPKRGLAPNILPDDGPNLMV